MYANSARRLVPAPSPRTSLSFGDVPRRCDVRQLSSTPRASPLASHLQPHHGRESWCSAYAPPSNFAPHSTRRQNSLRQPGVKADLSDGSLRYLALMLLVFHVSWQATRVWSGGTSRPAVKGPGRCVLRLRPLWVADGRNMLGLYRGRTCGGLGLRRLLALNALTHVSGTCCWAFRWAYGAFRRHWEEAR